MLCKVPTEQREEASLRPKGEFPGEQVEVQGVHSGGHGVPPTPISQPALLNESLRGLPYKTQGSKSMRRDQGPQRLEQMDFPRAPDL